MYGKSPMMKRLIGKQHNLPEHLKAKIEASPAQQTEQSLNVKKGSAADNKTKIAEANEESKAQEAKGENEGQQIIGRVKRGEISQEEGNKLLSALQDG